MTAAAVAAVAALVDLPGVAADVDATREAMTSLRWHEALRRRIPQAAAESRVRGATASAELDGARMPVAAVRDIMRGASTWHTPLDPVEMVARGAVAATAETEHLAGVVLRSPRQALARLHVAAARDLAPTEVLGRPRLAGEECSELVGVGPAVPPQAVSERLAALVAIITAAGSLPGPIVAAVVHAEVAVMRPFTVANGVVARALERAVVQAGGLDPTGVAVPEWGYGSLGGTAYVGALHAYAEGSPEGVRLWLLHAGTCLRAAAAEGVRIADSVRIGRL